MDLARRSHELPQTRLAALGFAIVCTLTVALLALAPAARADSGGLSSSYSGETVETPSIPASDAEAEVPGVEAPSGVRTPAPAPEPAPDPGSSPAPAPAPTPAPTVPGALATLRGERAIAPRAAPRAVKRVIAAANHIRRTPYIWGGGHARWRDKGYDCSGSVSYVLHGGRLLESPLVSGSFMRWGEPGPGRWITIYANKGHVYMVVAGLRWDTGGDPEGVTGPRWHEEAFQAKGFAVRHPVGY